ncbi:hypothetical protein I317_01501 [Kwoniella heveanensis CBS 569]|nr:hypothetical protein I317_01501 [Kwoniella heveanensis CBS 569]
MSTPYDRSLPGRPQAAPLHQLPPLQSHPYPQTHPHRAPTNTTQTLPQLPPASSSSRHSSSSTPLPTLSTIITGAVAGSSVPTSSISSATGAAASTSTPTTATKKSRQKRSSFSVSDHSALENSQELSKVRAYAACRSCRTKKIKCLPGLPSVPAQISPDGQPVLGPCQQCVQVGSECTYPPTRDRAAYSRQYVQNLEVRVQALEAMQARVLPLLEMFEGSKLDPLPLPVRAKTESTDRVENDSLQQGPAAVDTSANIVVSEGENENENEDGNDGEEDELMQGSDEVEDAGQMTQDERGNYRYIGSSNTLSLLDSFSRGDRDRDKEKDRETYGGDKDGDHENEDPTRPGLSTSRHPSHTNRSLTHASDPNSRQSPAISDHATRGPNPYFGPVAGSGVVKALPPVHEVQFPSPKLAAEMIDAFFEEVHPCLPVVLEHDFRRSYKELMEAIGRGERSTHGTFLAVLFAIFALGERTLVTSEAWDRERKRVHEGSEGEEETVLPGEAEAGVIWYERSHILHFTTIKDIDIHQVQCLTLLAAFQASVNAMPMSWLLAGQALRLAQDLGLHRSTSRLPLSFAEKQLRSRCWWAIYGLERMMSIALGRPLGVDDLDIDVAYPSEIDDEGLEKLSHDGTPTRDEPIASTMSGFIALSKLSKIAGRVAHLLYRPANEKSVSDPSWAASQQNAINKLDKLLRDWLDNDVPTKYKDPSATRSVSLVSAILSNSYFAILITLHRNFLPSNPDYPRPKPPPSSQSLARCVDAARSVIHIASQSRTLVPPSHHLAVYCQYLWSSAVILLLCEVQAKDDVVIEAVGSHVESCRRSLQALEPVWPGSRKLKELLNDVASRAKEVATVTSKTAMRPGKKRKTAPSASTSADGKNGNGQGPISGSSGGQMRPPPSRHQSQSVSPSRPATTPLASGQQGSWQGGGFSASANPNPEKRQRMYETSDTRTPIVLDDGIPVFTTRPSPHHTQSGPFPQSAIQNQTGYYNPQSTYSPVGPSQTSSIPTQGQGDISFDAVYDTFDLGGLSFNPSELLQGFGDSASTFWNNMTFIGGDSANNNAYNTGGIGSVQAAQATFSGQNTPNSAGAGPSPAMTHLPTSATASATAQQSNPNAVGSSIVTPATGTGMGTGTATQAQGQGQYTPQAHAHEMVDPLAEFWAQVAGNTFDWQADPNVPFNI